jgi:hypothetical protein
LFWPLPLKLPIGAVAVALVSLTALYVVERSPDLRPAIRLDAPRPAHAPSAPPAESNRPATPRASPKPGEPPRTGPALEAARSAEAPADAVGARVATAPGPAPVQSPELAEAPPSPEAAGARRAKDAGQTAPSAVPPGEAAARDRAGPPAPAGAEAEAKSLTKRSETASGTPAAPAPREEEVAAPATRDAARLGQATEQSRAAGRPDDMRAPAAAPERQAAGAEDFRARKAEQALGRGTTAAATLSGRLSVADRVTAHGAISGLVAELGGLVLSRPPAPGGAPGDVVELVVPRAGYARLRAGLATLGRLELEAEPAALPDPVRLTIQLSD